MATEGFTTRQLSPDVDAIAPDGSEIRTLGQTQGGSIGHCTLPAGRTSLAVRHRSVEEIWYCLEGEGEVWRRLGDQEEVVAFRPGVSLTIPKGTHFQFRASGDSDLRFLLVTMPPWPGADEAVRVADHWEV